MTQLDAKALLRRMLGQSAEFRSGQWEAIDLVANQRRRLLVVQRTGWGKSIVYFLATKILRYAGAGPTLLISPLLALMRNQILAAGKLGIRAQTIHSANVEEWASVETALKANECDILLISPERLGNADFLQRLLSRFQGDTGLFVVDEAHCISDWGHDFRPDYRRIVRILRLLQPGLPVLCTTATANNRVVQDVLTQIPNLEVRRGPLMRDSLRLYNIRLPDQTSRLAWLAHFVPRLAGSGIIYCLTIQDVRRVAAWLQHNGVEARAYHADLESEDRVSGEELLLTNKIKALVATVALGMGFDKPDLGFVIHFQRPGSVVAYYQQVGRAGRAVDSAYGILLSGQEDDDITDYFIRTAFPPAEVMQEILRHLQQRAAMTLDEICAELNQSRGTVEKALKLLEVDGAVQREGNRFIRTANPWQPDTLRATEITEKRRAEQAEMQRYVEHTGCLMEYLARALDDPTAAPCGKCMNCTQHIERRETPHELVQQAVAFLRGDVLVLEPRRRWPKPIIEEVQKMVPAAVEVQKGQLKVTIPEHFVAREGRVLCLYGDAGWGGEVARGKYETGRFSDELANAAAAMIQNKWKPDPPPAWITTVPSLHHPELLPSLAAKLAARLNVPFVVALRKKPDAQEQKEMLSSSTQLRNVLKAFEIAPLTKTSSGNVEIGQRSVPSQRPAPGLISAVGGVTLPSGPVLLVDDVVDSGWTLTWLAVMLRQYGSGPVYPFALAKASPRGS